MPTTRCGDPPIYASSFIAAGIKHRQPIGALLRAGSARFVHVEPDKPKIANQAQLSGPSDLTPYRPTRRATTLSMAVTLPVDIGRGMVSAGNLQLKEVSVK